MRLTIFDLDRTLLKTNVSFKFYFYLYKNKIFSKKSIFKQLYYLICYRYFNMSLQTLHNVTFNTFLKNKSYDDIKRHVNVFLDKYLVKLFYLPAVLRLQKAILENHFIAIYSSSPFFLVQPIADILKVNEFKSTLYSLSDHNKFENIRLILDGEKKAEYALELMDRLKISKEDVYVYSDSSEDLLLFEIAENKIAVQPSKNLKKLFKKNSWEII